MTDTQILDQVFHFLMETFVKRGSGPHYTEIAKKLGVNPEEGKKLLHDLINTGIMPMWLHPGTDLLASFAPFNNLPTQYRITVEGKQKWFGQWGFEALAVCWAFPGKAIQIDAPCLDCGKPIHIVVRDGKIESHRPTGIHGYIDIPLRKWSENWSFSWGRMNLFRSEEHVKNWTGFIDGTEAGILPLDKLMTLFSTPRHRAKFNGNYVSTAPEYAPEFFETIRRVTGNSSFWNPTI